MRKRLTGPARVLGLAGLALSAVTAASVSAPAATADAALAPPTATPIKHVIVIIGENHSFDNVFATYQPRAGQRIDNLLSEGIVTKNGGLGPNWKQAQQLTASDTKKYSVTPKITGAYQTLPRPNTNSVPQACDGQAGNSPDARFPATLPGGPYQITRYVPYFDSHTEYSKYGQCEFYGAYVGDPLHRFYQMTQQTLGYRDRLATWVANTAGDDNGALPPAPIYQGGVQMGYYNMARGDAPILRDLAQHYAMAPSSWR